MIYVTGATGLVGRSICELLIQKGESLRCLKRSNSSIPASLINLPIEWVEGDLNDINSQVEFMQGAQKVIHSAGMVSFRKEDKKALTQNNIKGTRTIVNACLEAQVPDLLYISSIAAIAGAKHSPIISEEIKWENGPEVSYYAQSKYSAELEVWRGEAEGLNVIVFNPAIVLGIGKPGKSSFQLIEYLLDNHRAFPNRHFHYVDIRDVAQSVWNGIQREPYSQRFILCAPSSTYEVLYQTFANHQKSDKRFISINQAALRLVYGLDWLRSKCFRVPQRMAKDMLKPLKPFDYDASKATKQLSIQFRPLSQTVPWLLDQIKPKS